MLLPFFYTAAVSRQEPIYLIGMMGAGKSTVGPRLAARLGRSFVDSDLEVERAAGRTIAEIFEVDGEARFRALEADVIEKGSFEGAVVALGGGAIVVPGAVERLRERGLIVFLAAEPAVLADRIGSGTERPLLAGLDRPGRTEKLAALLAERLPFYSQAQIQVDAAGNAEAVVDRIVAALDVG